MSDAISAQAISEPAAPSVRRVRFFARARSSPWALRIGLTIVAIYVLVAVFAPSLAPHDPLAQDVMHSLAPPSAEYPLGTDGLGRDLLSRLIYGARIDLALAASATGLSLILGTTLGMLAGYARGWVDLVLSRLVDMMMAIPAYPLLVLLLLVLGQNNWSIVLAFAVTGWVGYARLTRGQVMSVRQREYVTAAQLGALGHGRIMIRHVLPNVGNQIIVLWASEIVLAISAIAALGYLGIGIQAPTPEWGVMVAEGQGFLLTNWLLATAPGLVIVVLGIGLALISDSLAGRGERR